MKTIITAGSRYADIDALACAYAYKDLLLAKGVDAEIVFQGPLNASVPKSIIDWGIDIKTKLPDDEKDFNFVIVDTSERAKFPDFVSDEKIIEIFDHHMMFTDQWIGKNIKTKIEQVGACATLIWEEIKSQNLTSKISDVSVKLIYTAIFSNTLNFNAGVTTDRDKMAFKEVEEISHLDSNWIQEYYQETEREILANPKDAILNDSKIIDIPKENRKIAIGQMELWNSKDFIFNNTHLIKEVLDKLIPNNWFMTAPSISEGRNYLYTESVEIKEMLGSVIGAKFIGDIGITEKLWLRKEILMKILV